MVNFRVDDLDRMRAQLKALGDAVDQKVEDTEQSRSGWVRDPDGTRIELWQPAPKPLP
jgi:predicted enzyme related to lactoylglutathione lyase